MASTNYPHGAGNQKVLESPNSKAFPENLQELILYDQHLHFWATLVQKYTSNIYSQN